MHEHYSCLNKHYYLYERVFFMTCLIALTPSSVQSAFGILQYDSEELGCRFCKAEQLVVDIVSQETQYFTVFSCAPHYQSSLIKCDMIWTQ